MSFSFSYIISLLFRISDCKISHYFQNSKEKSDLILFRTRIRLKINIRNHRNRSES